MPIALHQIEHSIFIIRGQPVMLDRDLACLYGVETRVLVQAVKRNLKRFPEDFMFQLSKSELKDWMSQIVISNPAAKIAVRKCPYAFTEHGVAMLSSVLHSDQAIEVNIAIVRAFTKLRQIAADNKDLSRKINDLEKKRGFSTAFSSDLGLNLAGYCCRKMVGATTGSEPSSIPHVFLSRVTRSYHLSF
jgi:DNA-directed RNA polymerase subunit N (RpoN/RPB10)